MVAENKLFATLDPTVRRLGLPSGQEALLVDTVGIIRYMPENLLQAFKATFEDFEQADAYLHVVDVSRPNYEDRVEEVNSVLLRIGLLEKPQLYALNKADLVQPQAFFVEEALKRQSIIVSTKTGFGIPKLLETLEGLLEMLRVRPGFGLGSRVYGEP